MSGLPSRVLPADPATRAAAFSVALNAVSAAVKLVVGLISGSVAVLSDGFDSLEDLLASGIALASVRYGRRPPDLQHPYGHGRAETIAATIQALLILGIGAFILYSAVRRILDPPESIDTDLAIVVMLIAAAANIVLVRYMRGVAAATRSPVIASEARHLLTNVVQALGVTVGLVVVWLTGEVALDGVIAFALGCYLLWTAAVILKASVGDVLDRSLDEEEIEQVEAIITRVAGDRAGFHGLRSRRTGQVRHIDFRMTFPGEMTVEDSHAIVDEVERGIERQWPGSIVTVHTEPQSGVPTEPPL